MGDHTWQKRHKLISVSLLWGILKPLLNIKTICYIKTYIKALFGASSPIKIQVWPSRQVKGLANNSNGDPTEKCAPYISARTASSIYSSLGGQLESTASVCCTSTDPTEGSEYFWDHRQLFWHTAKKKYEAQWKYWVKHFLQEKKKRGKKEKKE